MARFFFISVTILSLGINLLHAQIPFGYNPINSYPSTQQQRSTSSISNFQQGKIDTKKRETTKQKPAISLNDSTITNNNTFKKQSNNSLTGSISKIDSLDKMIFGKSFFQNKNLFFEPNLRIATPQNYIVGPEDELIVDIFGYSEDHYNLTVSSDGYVKIPKIGIIQVSGLTIQEVKKKIVSRLSKIFVGLKSEGTGVSSTNLYASITLGNIRQINVLVQGEVENPGSFNVPSLAKAINVLYLAGGPTVNGTFRNIELIRNNKVIGKIDLYDYLIGGILKNDFTLQDRDIIKVGLYENRVTLQGKVKRSQIFEFTKDEHLDKIIEHFGGGFAEDAYKQNVKLIRFTNKEKKILDIGIDLTSGYTLKTGDVVIVESINTDRFENRVKILGEVWRPGDYSLDNCPTVHKLIEKAGGFKENAFISRVLIKRLMKDNLYENIAINFSDLQSSNFVDIPLRREDEVFVQAIDKLREDYTVTIHGEINFKPETNSSSSRLMTSSDLQRSVQSDEESIKKEDEIEEDFKSNEANNQLLNRQTKLTLPYVSQMTVEDLIVKSGGLRESANSGFVEIVRRNKSYDLSNGNSFNKIGELFKFPINKDLTLDVNASKFILEPFDEVFIRSASGYQIQQFVTLKGEVKFPGVYGLEIKDEKISSLINRAGNLTIASNIDGASLLRKRKRSVSDDIIRQNQIKNLENNYNGVEIQNQDPENFEYEKIGIELNKILKNPGGSEDLTVEDGDIIDIPILKQTVKISGEIIHPTTIMYKKNYNFKDYINHSGGFTQKSARKRGYVIYANGSINKTKQFLFFRNYPKIMPGSEIVIPAYNRNTQQLASTIGVYTGTITSLVSVFLLLRATLN